MIECNATITGDTLAERHWIELTVRPSEPALNTHLKEPEKSRHLDFKQLEIPLTRDEALASPPRDEFFEVADHIEERETSVPADVEGRKLITSRTLHLQWNSAPVVGPDKVALPDIDDWNVASNGLCPPGIGDIFSAFGDLSGKCCQLNRSMQHHLAH